MSFLHDMSFILFLQHLQAIPITLKSTYQDNTINKGKNLKLMTLGRHERSGEENQQEQRSAPIMKIIPEKVSENGKHHQGDVYHGYVEQHKP
jgi:hypothetical protein